jgi:hypothetical protein
MTQFTFLITRIRSGVKHKEQTGMDNLMLTSAINNIGCNGMCLYWNIMMMNLHNYVNQRSPASGGSLIVNQFNTSVT